MSTYQTELTIVRPAHLGGTQWILKNLNEITILFGKNGSGKSKLLRTLRDSDKNTYHYTSPERAGDITHDVGIMQEELTGDKRANRSQQNLSPTYRQEAVSRIQALQLKIGNVTGHSGEKSPVSLNEIKEFISILLPDFEFKVTDQNPPYELKRLPNGEKVTSVNHLSSGESEILTLALDILTVCAMWEIDKQEQKILLIDEPDTHLHPDLQQHLANFLVKVLEKYKVQMIIATHSTTLLSALGYHGEDKTSIIYLNNSTTDQVAKKFDKVLQELSTCLGGHALMGPLFNAPLLLVEGDDENKIWSQIPRYNKVKIAVIPCNGGDEVKNYQKTLEKLFSNLRSDQSTPVGYALLDSDKSIPNEDAHNSQKNIKYLQLSCLESENLFLTDEVLTLLGTNWDNAKTKIKQESLNYGEKKTKLDSCDTWDRKTVDVKDVIQQLIYILDPDKKVPWTIRVAKCIGDKKPEGQIADFLGTEIINALWKD